MDFITGLPKTQKGSNAMTDFSKYIIATDLDGTFFNDHSQFVSRNVEAIKRFCAGGGLFTLATGRVQLTFETVE
jgi:hypothetical protein